MSVKNTNVDGSQSISQDLTVGGKASVRNTAEFARNVVVKGWLDAPNVKHAFKGLYSTETSLYNAYPKPQVGWYALVADTETEATLEGTAIVYIAENGKWEETSLTSAQLDKYVDTIEETISDLSAEVSSVTSAIEENKTNIENLEETVKNFSEEVESDYVKFTDVAVADGENDKNGVMSIQDKYTLQRLHKASAHVSYFLESVTAIVNQQLSDVRAVCFVKELQTFVASPNVDGSAPYYAQWEETNSFHSNIDYMYDGVPYNKLYVVGDEAYVWDSNQKEMILLGDFSNYVTFVDYATSSRAGVVKVMIGNGLTVTDGVLAIALATATSNGAMSAEDKAKLDKLIADVATYSTDGYMSATDKIIVDNVAVSIPIFSGIQEESVLVRDTTLSDVYAVLWAEASKSWIAQDVNGLFYSKWTASGAFQSSEYYAPTADRAYLCTGVLYRYDEKLETLIRLTDLSDYITNNDVATAETNGLLSAGDKVALDFVYDAIHSGRITNGTMRFDNYCCSKNMNGSLDETTEADSYDGVMWLKDKKMFVAYRAILTINDCGCATVTYTFYTHWVTAHLYMENIAQSEGLWQEKVYIHNGCLYVWKRCEEQLVLASAAANVEAITEEEIDEALADFEFVEGGSTGGITDVDAKGESPLNLDAERNGSEVLITGDVDIGEISADKVDEMFSNI